jgi:hypothetical protein
MAGATVDEILGVFLGQAARPLLKPPLGEIGAFRVGVPKRPAKLVATTTIQFAADGLRDEAATVLLPPVDVSDHFRRETHGYAFDACHFILSV